MWLKPDGNEMSEQEWSQGFARCLGMFLAGAALPDVDAHNRPLHDENFLLLFNAHHEPIPFSLPRFDNGGHWRRLLDTTGDPDLPAELPSGTAFPLQGRSLVLLMQRR
jgi:glycogen operon protein